MRDRLRRDRPVLAQDVELELVRTTVIRSTPSIMPGVEGLIASRLLLQNPNLPVRDVDLLTARAEKIQRELIAADASDVVSQVNGLLCNPELAARRIST